MRAFLVRFLITLLGFSSALAAVPVRAATFTDVSAQTQYRTAIESLQAKGVLKGYTNGSFLPKSTINRAEFLKIVLEARGEVKTPTNGNCFLDVKTQDWFSKYACRAKEDGIVQGYSTGKFEPGNSITFVEAAKIVALAYKQDVQSNGNSEWYEKYVRALENGKAIPTSIAKLDAKITRGEMAEMMWRIQEGKTDQPSKTYLNVKYPELKVDLSSDKVQLATSCTDLKAFTQESQAMNQGGGIMRDMAADGVAAPMAGAMEKSTTNSTADYSQTNVQVEGVDEGDVVKTDGKELYIISNQKVRLVRANPATSLQEDASIDFSDKGFTPSDLYINGTTLIILGSHWDNNPRPVPMMKMDARMIYPPMYNQQRSEVRLYDVSDPKNPKAVRTVAFEGNTVSTRMIGSKLYLITQKSPYWYGPLDNVRAESVVPLVNDSAAGGTDIAAVPCNKVMILPRVPSPAYLTVAVIPVNDVKAEVKREVILGNGENVYMSLGNLYVASTEWMYNWDPINPQSSERTNVYRFAIESDGVGFKAKGSVPGHLLNQFSMDEMNTTFRVATTKQQTWSQTGNTERPSTNNLYVLNMDMQKVGSVEDIAPGETIYSVRFMGKRAYMVTFQKIDPFFVIDLSDSRNPKILGKLKIPGYSDYLHPFDDTHVIGFGKEAVAAKEGNFAWYQGMKLAIFDVTDPENPTELHKVSIGDRGTESPLLHNHKALLFDKERGLLAFPVSVAKIPDDQKKPGSEQNAYGTPVFQGAYVYDVSLKNGFNLKGTVTHYPAEAFMKAGEYWYGGTEEIQRIVRIGESLLTVSNAEVQAHAFGDLKKQSAVKFAGEEPPVERY